MTGLAAQPQARPSLLSLRQKKITSRILIYFLLFFIAAVIIIPLAWMVSTSFKPKSEWFMPQIYWIPRTFTLQNYQSIFNNPALPMVRWFANSLLVATSVTVLVLVVDSLAGYAYARMKFRGRNVIFSLLLVTMFLPGMMFLIPNFLTVNALGWLNSIHVV